MTRAVMMLIFGLTSAMTAIAQERTVVTINEPPTSYYAVGKAQVSYFAGPDTTEVRIELRTHRVGRQGVTLWFVSMFEGKRVVTPKDIFVGLSFRSDKAELQKVKSFMLWSDKQPLNVYIKEIKGLTFELDGNEWARAMDGSLPFDEFRKLVTGESARVQIANLEYEMDAQSRAALHDMLKALTEPRPKS